MGRYHRREVLDSLDYGNDVVLSMPDVFYLWTLNRGVDQLQNTPLTMLSRR